MELVLLLAAGLFGDNKGIYVQIGSARKSIYSEYHLSKHGMEYGSDDSLVSVSTIDGIPCLAVAGNAETDQLVGLGITDSSFRGLNVWTPVYITIGYYDDTTGSSTGGGKYRFTLRYDGYTDDDSNWEWLGSWDSDGDGYWDSVESGIEVYKLDTDTWRRWTVCIPTPEFSSSLGVGLADSQLMLHNRCGGPEAYSFVSIVKVEDATHFVFADDNWTEEGWGGGGSGLYNAGSSPMPELDTFSKKSGLNSLRVKFYFDSPADEWFDIGPTSAGSLNYGSADSQPIGYGSAKVPCENRENVVIGAWMKAGVHVASKVKIFLRIVDAEGEVFIIGPRRFSTENMWEYISFPLSGKVGQWWIWEDGDKPGDNKITFPVRFVSFRFNDDPDTVDDLAPGYVWIDRVQIRTDETPPYPPEMLSPEEGASFRVGENITFRWSITDDLYSGLNLTAPVYRLQVARDSKFYDIIFSEDYYQDFTKGYIEKNIEFSQEGTYYWRVRVVDRMGNYCYTSVKSFLVSGSDNETVEDNRTYEEKNQRDLSSFLSDIPEVHLMVFPNPVIRSSGDSRIKLASSSGEVVYFTVYDLFGNRIATGVDVWNLKDFSGKDVPPGVYFVRAVVEDEGKQLKTSLYKIVVR